LSDKPLINGRTVRILIVDDEEIVLSLARDALEDGGYEIELAGKASEAVAWLEREFFDFILTDIRMPECDGIQLARKARDIIPSIGVIFMTGYANLSTAKDAIKEGAYDYIMKPFELREIRQAVKNAVIKKQNNTEKTLNSELSRLSELNELMYTVGDRQSLIRLSLGFGLIQGKTDQGMIAYQKDSNGTFGIISARGFDAGNFEEATFEFEHDYFSDCPAEMETPFVITAIDEHPLFKQYGNTALKDFLIPPWYTEGDQLVNVSLKRGSKLYGILILGYGQDDDKPKDSDQKFLQITANQIAISLENISLLEESRNAYGRLKDLQDQTIQLEKMAAKGEMSAQIGHELNNYLGVVSGNISLMEHHLKQKNYSELERYLGAANNSLAQMKKFTTGLMDFASLEASFESCEINSLIKNTLDYLHAQKHLQDIDLSFDSNTPRIVTTADLGQLQQLLYNMINNAADAIHDKTDAVNAAIKIHTELTESRDTFILTITDNGVGFDPPNRERAFKDRFTTKKTGHGFGLLVCKRIIDNHKGRMHLESSPGQGAIFTLTFPVKTVQTEPAPVG